MGKLNQLYHINWLLSACAYSNQQQETMHLIKSMKYALNSECALNREGFGIEGGASNLA